MDKATGMYLLVYRKKCRMIIKWNVNGTNRICYDNENNGGAIDCIITFFYKNFRVIIAPIFKKKIKSLLNMFE